MSNCPCGKEVSYEQCCGKFHTKKDFAKTAEELMRSRYCAYVKGHVDYIIQTNDPDTRDEIDPQEVKDWSEKSEWLGLEILQTKNGQIADEDGVVEFKATYKEGDVTNIHHERSTFFKDDDRWYYDDGMVYQNVDRKPKVGRNDPCLCGSGKKYKKCCLAK